MKKIFYYIFIPTVIYIALIVILYFKVFRDFENTIGVSATIIQSLAILIGGLWAYHKFGWEKKCENIITLKATLMEYAYKHNLSAAQFHEDKDVAGYKLRILTSYKDLSKKIHLSYYVPAKLRKKIFDTIWLTVGNDAGKNYERIGENWDKFEKQLQEIYNEFDKIISL